MIESAIGTYISHFLKEDDDALASALYALQKIIGQWSAEEVRAHFLPFCRLIADDEAFRLKVGVQPVPETAPEAYAAHFDAPQLADLLLHPPDLLLTALACYTPEQLMSELYYPRNTARKRVQWTLQPTGSDTIYCYVSDTANNYPDLYAGRSMPFNGRPADFAYAYHLPLTRLVKRYFPGRKICITSDREVIGKNPYFYILSPKDIYRLWETDGAGFLDRNLPGPVKDDLAAGRAIIIFNNLHEGNQLSRKLHLIANAVRKLKPRRSGQVIFLSGNGFDARAWEDFRRGRPTWRPNLADTLRNSWASWQMRGNRPAFDWMSFAYFEESTRAWMQRFLPDYSYAARLEQLEASTALKHFLCLNRVVKDFRVALSYFFWSHHLLEKSYISQAALAENYPAGKPILKIPNKEEYETFRATLPWMLDTVSFGTNLWNVLPERAVNNSFLWVVTETNFSSYDRRTQFATEKTFKPIALYMPFILVGNPGDLARLQARGYQTFHRWWDESYDDEPRRTKRIEMIEELIYSLSLKPTAELMQMYREMQPVLEHNHRQLMQSAAGREAVELMVGTYDALRR